MAAPDSHHMMTFDQKAAYLNANVRNLQVPLFLSIDVTGMIFYMNSSNVQHLRKHGKLSYSKIISGTSTVLTLRAGDGERQHTAVNGSRLRVVPSTGGAQVVYCT